MTNSICEPGCSLALNTALMILRQMTTRHLVLIPLVLSCFGCGKSAYTPSAPAAPPAPASAPAPKMETLARVHWLGMKSISSDTNAASLMQVWNLRESARLEEQTLDKLAAAPWRFLRNTANPAATNLLHPLLQDLVNEESYLEIRQPADATNSTANDMVLAIRLDDRRAALWNTNLAAALESLTGIRPTNFSAGHWVLKKHHAPNLIELVRVNDWTVLGAGRDHNALLDEVLARIQREGAPAGRWRSQGATNAWLKADINLPKLADLRQITGHLAGELPRVSLITFGNGTNVYTTGELVFPSTDFATLAAWEIPTNLIQPNLTSFAAVRGIAPLLKSCAGWNELNAGPPPDQLYAWSLSDYAMETYFAAPSAEASNAVSKITDLVLQKSQEWHLTNGLASFRKARAYNGLEWGGLPYLTPFLKSAAAAGTKFIFGGFFLPRTMDPASSNVFSEIYGATNLIYYSSEQTGERVDQLVYPIQFARAAAGKSQLPKSSAGLLWLEALGPKLRESTTRWEKTAIPGHLEFYRRSSIGLTALELHLLADWLESPDFPQGLHTFRASAPH